MRKLKLTKKKQYYTNRVKSDIFYINDLIRDDRNFLSLCEIRNKYKIHVNSLRLPRVVTCSSMQLDKYSVRKLNNVVNKHTLILCASQKVVKLFYSSFLQKVFFIKPIKTQEKWQVDLEQIIENENWNLYYETAMKNVLNTNLQTFQYTINFIY
jgi:hypothetical protein